MIYLASPYAHKDAAIMLQRYLLALQVTAELIKQLKPIYSPIVHNHVIAEKHNMPKGWNFWEQYDLQMLDAANILYILKIDGWKKSVGLKAEVRYAWYADKIVFWIDPNTRHLTHLTREQFAEFFMEVI